MIGPQGEIVADPAPRVDILIVDDDTKNLLALEAMLEGLDQNVVRAQSGTEALRRLLERDFALALLDVQMPELDGFQTASLIRARDRSRHMPIIFLTAHNRSDEQVAQAYSLGAVDFLFKPIVPSILQAKVSAFVDLFRKTEEVKRQGALLRDIERREHERRLQEAAQRWEAEHLREEMARERQTTEAMARIVADLERAESALRQSNQRLRLLSETANRLLFDADPRTGLADLCRELSEHMQLEVYAHHAGDDPAPLARAADDGTLGDATDAVAREVSARRRAFVAESLAARDDDASAPLAAGAVHRYACFPLVALERMHGTLGFGTRRDGMFTPDDLAALQGVSDQVAMALERARLVDELSRRNRALAEMDRRKDEFLAMLAHELRNPLAPIVSAVQVLRSPDANTGMTDRARDAIDRQVHHMVRLVDDLLDLSRITTGKVELRRERVTLADVIDHAVQTSAPLLGRSDHALTVTLPPEPVTLYADFTRLGQVVANLLNNAARYSPPGGAVRLTCAREGEFVTISVRDQGVGIEPEMLSKIFDLFVQSERRSDRSLGGLGIGLTLARSLVEMHGGTVTASSEGLGRGSEFVVRLPLPPPEVLAATPEPPPEVAAPSSLRVVVIEDNADVREMMRDHLILCGHRVEVAADGREGIDLVLAERPQVALVDIGLPGIDGYGVASELRARLDGAPVRLIALTGYGRPEDRARALAAGFDAHLVKPVDPDQLTAMLAQT